MQTWWCDTGVLVYPVTVANRLTPEWATAREIVVPPILWESGVIFILQSLSNLQVWGFLLNRNRSLSPLDHLLRSSDSAVFKSLLTSWNASEVEITRALLFLTKITQELPLLFDRLHLEQRGGGAWMRDKGARAGTWSTSIRFCRGSIP